VSFPAALLRRLPFFTVKRKVEAHQPASAPAAVPEQVSAPIEAACGDSSADVGTSRQIGSSRKDEVLPQASAGVGTPQRQSPDSGMPKAVASADIGLPRRLLEEDLGSFAFTPHDDGGQGYGLSFPDGRSARGALAALPLAYLALTITSFCGDLLLSVWVKFMLL
jgi:hypothetical protein